MLYLLVGRQNIRLLRPTKPEDPPRLRGDQAGVTLGELCRTEVRKQGCQHCALNT